MAQMNKNLGKCQACDGVVSKKAKACPHCGQKKPFKQGPIEVPKPVAWAIIGLTLLMAIPIVMMPQSDSSNSMISSTGRSGYANYSDPAKQQSWILNSQDGIRNKLKDPGSAKFKDSFFIMWKGTPIVCGEVNSKNSLGGYGGFQRFVAAGSETAYLEEEVADFGNVWREMCQR